MTKMAVIASRLTCHFTWVVILLMSGTLAADEEIIVDERLLPAATSYVDLLLCAETAKSFLNDEAGAERYMKAAFKVQDLAEEAGWDSYAIAATITKLEESRSDLDLREDDSRESFYRRNFSGERCERELQNVRVYRENGVPSP